MLTKGKAAIRRTALLVGFGLVLLPAGLSAAEKVNTYLALGDSVAFGLDVRLLDPAHPPSPSQFAGYPEIIGFLEGLPASRLIDTSCPGETSKSFIDSDTQDYGCNGPGPQGQPPFKASIGLHVNYLGMSQLAYAMAQLSTNHKINLVSLGIGSNDVLIALRDCNNDAVCAAPRIPGILQSYAQNLAQILGAIRSKYSGTLILVKYYSPSADLNSIAVALNSVMQSVGSNFNVKFADGYAAFQVVSAPFGGNPCRAGLLVPLGPGVCDIHPSKFGSTVLAATIETTRLTQ